MEKVAQEELAFIAVGMTITLLNSVEIILLLRMKNKKAFDKLLLSLALSDWLVGIAVTIFKITDFVVGKKPWLKEDIFVIVFFMSSSFSMKNLLAITIDRFIAIKLPIKHRVLVTGRLVNITIAIIWIVVLFVEVGLNLILIVGFQISNEYYTYQSAIAIILLGILISILYVWILRVLFTRQMSAKTGTSNGKVAIGHAIQSFFTGPYKSERAVVLSSVLVAVSFIICTYPFAIESFKTKNPEDRSLSSRVLIVLNSLVNPLIYFFKNYFAKWRRQMMETNNIEMNEA